MTQPDQPLRKAPRVTVVTPTFNRADLLPLTARSVLDQTFPDFEYVILDDGSADHTAAVVQQLGDPRISYFRHENRGEAATTNRGWAMARGEYFAILSSDDLVKPRWLERLVRFMDENPEVLVAYPDYDIIDAEGRVTGMAVTPDYDRDRMIASFHPSPGVGAVIRRSVLRNLHALRNPEYRYAPDLDSWLRLGLRGPFARVPEVLGSWRSHQGSITVAARNRERATEMVRIAERFFALPDLPRDVLRLRPFALAQAWSVAGWVIRDTDPFRAALCLRRSHVVSPVQPDFIPSYLGRLPRPGYRQILRLLGASLRHRSVAALRVLGRRMPPAARRAGAALLSRLGMLPPPAPAPTAAVTMPAAPDPMPVAPDPARLRIEALMPQIRDDLMAFREGVAVLSPTSLLLDTLRGRATVLPAPALASVTGRILAGLPDRIGHLLVVPWARGIGGSETVTERLAEALLRLHGEEGLCILAPDASYQPAGLARHCDLPFLGLSDIEAGLDAAARAEILDRILLQRRPRVVHAINSRAAWDAIRERGQDYAADSALFANIYSDMRLADGAPAATYYFDYLPHCIAHFTSVIADNRAILRKAEAGFGLGPALRAKLHVVRTPVIGLAGGDPARELRPFRPSRERRSLWLSRIATEKRLDVLASLAARCPGRMFELRGADNGIAPDLTALQGRPNVAIAGPFGSLDDIPWDSYDSDVFTTSGEGMPIALLEAAARGLPLVAPDVGGIGEFVSPATGWLIPTQDDVGAYADALAQIEAEPEEARRRVEAAQALLLREHSRDAFDRALRAVPGYLGGRA